jgi:outer membrane protein assembly factor BamB
VTNRYYIDYKGHSTVFLPLNGKDHFDHPWIRGTCGFGVLPCNGLLYTTPYSCTCMNGRKIKGLQALYAHPTPAPGDQALEVARAARFVKGPAYGQEPGGRDQESARDWPTYRGDAQRSGSTDAPGPTRPQARWTTRLPATPSASVVAAGYVFVAAVDAHTLYALDADSGERRWTYVAGGRIDSPPTYRKGRVLFGSRDGWVHCLRASDGTLVWRFKDLPDKTVFDHGQPESAWPVCGSVLVHDDMAHFSAGRCPSLDGGLFLYSLDPETGACIRERCVDEYDSRRTAAILSASNPNGDRISPSAGFLDAAPHHRTNWYYTKHQSGDIMVMSGNDLYAVQGYPVSRVSFFDVRAKGYQLVAQIAGQREKARWSVAIPVTGRAMAVARDVVYVAGNPAYFPPDHDVKKYEAGYRGDLGGLLLCVSPTEGKTLSGVKLDAPPVWDGLAVANGRVYVSLRDGSVCCLEEP